MKIAAVSDIHYPFYRELFSKNNINIKNIKTLEDLAQIPVTTKTDLQERNDDFLCVDKNEVIDFIAL